MWSIFAEGFVVGNHKNSSIILTPQKDKIYSQPVETFSSSLVATAARLFWIALLSHRRYKNQRLHSGEYLSFQSCCFLSTAMFFLKKKTEDEDQCRHTLAFSSCTWAFLSSAASKSWRSPCRKQRQKAHLLIHQQQFVCSAWRNVPGRWIGFWDTSNGPETRGLGARRQARTPQKYEMYDQFKGKWYNWKWNGLFSCTTLVPFSVQTWILSAPPPPASVCDGTVKCCKRFNTHTHTHSHRTAGWVPVYFDTFLVCYWWTNEMWLGL